MKAIFGLGVCLFMGVLVISVGLGALFPPINRIAKPLVCSDGNMVQESQVYHPYPGKVVTSQTWYCVGEDGASKKQLSMFSIGSIAGTFYGLILFAILSVKGLFRGG